MAMGLKTKEKDLLVIRVSFKDNLFMGPVVVDAHGSFYVIHIPCLWLVFVLLSARINAGLKDIHSGLVEGGGEGADGGL